MLHRHDTDHLHFAVIGKTSAQIWGDDSGVHTRPVTVHDPRSRPHLGSVSGPKSTSNYDTRELAQGSRVKFKVIPGWLKPSIDERYCELIYKRVKECDRAFIVGGGIGRWSGINNFMSYLEEHHPEFAKRVEYRVYFRLTDFSESKLRKIFREMSEEESYE
jgi:hypothetical protein